MKVIDNKGRLFGKLNLIDLLVILLVLALAVAVVLKVTGHGADKDAKVDYSQGDINSLEYTVICKVVNRILLPSLQEEIGNQLMSNGELVEDCRILDIKVDPCMERIILDDGTVKTVENPLYCDLTFTIGGTAPYAENAYHVGSQEVRVGKSHIVKTTTMELTGTVIEMTGAAFEMEAVNG